MTPRKTVVYSISQSICFIFLSLFHISFSTVLFYCIYFMCFCGRASFICAVLVSAASASVHHVCIVACISLCSLWLMCTSPSFPQICKSFLLACYVSWAFKLWLQSVTFTHTGQLFANIKGNVKCYIVKVLRTFFFFWTPNGHMGLFLSLFQQFSASS